MHFSECCHYFLYIKALSFSNIRFSDKNFMIKDELPHDLSKQVINSIKYCLCLHNMAHIHPLLSMQGQIYMQLNFHRNTDTCSTYGHFEQV